VAVAKAAQKLHDERSLAPDWLRRGRQSDGQVCGGPPYLECANELSGTIEVGAGADVNGGGVVECEKTLQLPDTAESHGGGANDGCVVKTPESGSCDHALEFWAEMEQRTTILA
jgi:hypothetical protein